VKNALSDQNDDGYRLDDENEGIFNSNRNFWNIDR
jgi:hypothetical protein